MPGEERDLFINAPSATRPKPVEVLAPDLEDAGQSPSESGGIPARPLAQPAPAPAITIPATPAYQPHRLPLPAAVNIRRIRWSYATSIIVMHLVALLAISPWFFSWTGVVCCVLGLYIFGTLGINLCFHRLLTHRSFTCPRWVERSLAILGVCCLQEAPGRWVAIHRRHHQHSDEQPDPHSPLVTFLWGHVGWLVVENRDTDSFCLYQRYAGDLLRQRFYLNMERSLRWLWIYLAHAAVIAAVSLGAGWLLTGEWPGAIKFMSSILIWGVVVRTVLVWHITWSVNSLSHVFGYQSHDTGENSRNNWLVALISNGEGWHNNHHADQRSAAHGHTWWELDITYLTIRAMAAVGLAKNVMRHDRRDHDHRAKAAADMAKCIESGE